MNTHASPSRPAENRGILVIDDNPSLLGTTQALFAETDWRCRTCDDTVSALCALVEERPLAVLVDSEAGPLDAWRFALLVKQHPDFSSTRVILLTRQDDVVTRARARAAGMDASLHKPFTAEDLLGLLRRDEPAPDVVEP